jgi:uncharacterized protein YjeT (DUF2065 family)
MHDFIAALGLLLAIEGLTFAAFPGAAKRAAEAVSEAPEGPLRMIGLVAAVLGVLVLWLTRSGAF